MQLKRLVPLALASIALIAMAGCDSDHDRTANLGTIDPPDPIPATVFVDNVSGDGVAGVYVPEELPFGSAAAPVVAGSAWFIRGSSMVLIATVEDTATELLVSVSRADFGYFRIPLNASPIVVEESMHRASERREKLASAGVEAAASVQSAFRAPREVTLTLTPSATAANMALNIVAGNGTGISAVGSHALQVNLQANSSALLQASLNWIDDNDMDLHMVLPGGEERIYFAHKQGTNGGSLDLDSNPACSLDRINNENITWGATAPMPGEYIVMLDLWSACELPGPFPYLVTVTVGGVSSIYEGSITADPATGLFPDVFEITRVTIN